MNFNKAIIIGNLTQNPEVKKTTSGQSVTNFGVATNRVWNDPQGQKQQQTEFHNVVAWGRLAEIVGQYLAKGRLCMVEGRLQTRNWVDNAGVKHWKTEIIAENIQLGPRPQGQSPATASSYQAPDNTYDAGPTVSAPETAAPAGPATAPLEEEIKIEDIPF